MPTARELLAQADALMRRNRAPVVPADDIPELTDEVAVSAEEDFVPARREATLAGRFVDDVPELTDAVAYVDTVSIEAVPDDDVTRWLESELGAHSVTGADPDSIALVPPPTLGAVAPVAEEASADYAFEAIERKPATPDEPPSVETPFEEVAEIPAAAADGIAEPQNDAIANVVPAAVADDPTRWAALAEEIRMQVLQRIDIFTDTGLQQQLTARLQPIVDRASADLVAAINQHVGTLLRAYVAEAIEREIEKWRDERR